LLADLIKTKNSHIFDVPAIITDWSIYSCCWIGSKNISFDFIL